MAPSSRRRLSFTALLLLARVAVGQTLPPGVAHLDSSTDEMTGARSYMLEVVSAAESTTAKEVIVARLGLWCVDTTHTPMFMILTNAKPKLADDTSGLILVRAGSMLLNFPVTLGHTGVFYSLVFAPGDVETLVTSIRHADKLLVRWHLEEYNEQVTLHFAVQSFASRFPWLYRRCGNQPVPAGPKGP